MMGALPQEMNLEAFRAWRADASLWLPAVRDIAKGDALPHDAIEPFANGTNLVVALGPSLVLKLFPPPLEHQFRSERAALTVLAGRLDFAIPKIVAEGERGGWSYLAMTRLRGMSGKEAWPLLAESDKALLLAELGEAISQVQSVSAGPLAHLEPHWPDFIPRQIEGCRARHERFGLAPKLLSGLDALLEEARTIIPLDPQLVILTGEYVPENLLLTHDADRWRLSGIIDFGDVMTGFREYDLLGPSVFMSVGVPGRVQALIRGFGYAKAEIDERLTRRLLALMFLHRFSDPRRHIAIEGWEERVGSLSELGRLLWPVG
jgi:hygromycin-B 7''-O-kinase